MPADFSANDATAGVLEPPVAEVRDIKKHYRTRRGMFGRQELVTAIDGVSLQLRRGQTLALVGASGSGKTTLGRLMLGLVEPTAGAALFEGRDLAQLTRAELRSTRRFMQPIFQNPYLSLNPRLSVAETLAEGPRAHRLESGPELAKVIQQLLDRVGLPQRFGQRRPAELSGGECQRVAIARALALRPSFIVADEVTAALDLSVQAQILNLLNELQREASLSYLFISHDLDVVRHMADSVALLSRGKLVECTAAQQFFVAPKHALARELLAALPPPDPRAQFQWSAANGP